MQTTVIRHPGDAGSGFDGPASDPTQPGPAPYQGFGQPPPDQGPGQQYAGYGQQPATYPGGATPHAAWPVTPAVDTSADRIGLLSTVLMAAGALLGLGYAVWAFTARRSVFADFADGVSVSTDDARTNDRIDTAFAIVAGLVIAVALVVWVWRKVRGETSGGPLEIAGLAVSGVGVVVVLVGLVLSAGVSDGGSTIEQGEKGVTATLVTGSGFVLLAIGLLLGLLTAREAHRDGAGSW
jgi:hypothetical protein